MQTMSNLLLAIFHSKQMQTLLLKLLITLIKLSLLPSLSILLRMNILLMVYHILINFIKISLQLLILFNTKALTTKRNHNIKEKEISNKDKSNKKIRLINISLLMQNIKQSSSPIIQSQHLNKRIHRSLIILPIKTQLIPIRLQTMETP